MKNYLIIVLFSTLTAISTIAQTNVELSIHHKLGDSDFTTGEELTTNLGHSFNVSRLEYYVTRISIVHDGGTVTAVHDDTIALINAGDETISTIALGAHDFTSIEGVRFHVGVYDPLHMSDPTSYPAGHPLYVPLTGPTMHSGLGSGYTFVALEGMTSGGDEFILQTFGIANYHEVEVLTEAVDDDGTYVIHIDGDYNRALEDIALFFPMTMHGWGGEAGEMLSNFRDFVFSKASAIAALDELEAGIFQVYPNPSADGHIAISLNEQLSDVTIEVMNALGQIVYSKGQISGSTTELQLPSSGVYFVRLNVAGKRSEVQKVVMN